MIKTLVFDVGNVLIDFSYDRFFNWMRQHGAVIDDVDHFTSKVGLHEYEIRRFDDFEFLNRLTQLITRPVSRLELIARWNDLFSPVPSMLTLAEGLKDRYHVYLLSNTSGLHWRHLWRAYELQEVCHDGLASYQLGLAKPQVRAYEEFARRFNLRPETTVLIDDKSENVEGAQAAGWATIQHYMPRATEERLRLLGVELPDIPPESA